MVEMDERTLARKHDAMDERSIMNDRFRDRLNEKFSELSKRIKSLRTLIGAERDELISENQKLRRENRNLTNQQIQSRKNDINMIEPRGFLCYL